MFSSCLSLSFSRVYWAVSEFIFFQVSVTSEDQRAVDGKGIRRKLIDRLYQTYSSELSNKKFAYDGEKSLYTVGPLPQNKFHFAIILEDSFAKRYSHLLFFPCLTYWVHLIFKLTFDSFLPGSETGSPGGSESPRGSGKRSKRSFQSKTFKVEISYAARIPLKSISLALKATDADNSSQDALRVLDIILRQQAANRYHIVYTCSFLYFVSLL